MDLKNKDSRHISPLEVQIIARPPGDAPDWVRDAWIGLTLLIDPSCPTTVSISVRYTNRNIREYLKDAPEPDENTGGYPIAGRHAIEMLRQTGKIEAADWWLREAPHMLDTYFIFARHVCHICEEV